MNPGNRVIQEQKKAKISGWFWASQKFNYASSGLVVRGLWTGSFRKRWRHSCRFSSFLKQIHQGKNNSSRLDEIIARFRAVCYVINVFRYDQGGIIRYIQTAREMPLVTNTRHTKCALHREAPFENFLLHPL